MKIIFKEGHYSKVDLFQHICTDVINSWISLMAIDIKYMLILSRKLTF